MKKGLILFSAIVIAVGMSSCKAKESAYKAAYEKAQEKEVVDIVEPVEEEAPIVRPTTKPATPARTTADRTERVKAVNPKDASGLLRYNVVIGSFANITNANGLTERMQADGYPSMVVTNDKGMFRVIHSSFNTREEASAAREKVYQKYPGQFEGIWLLINE